VAFLIPVRVFAVPRWFSEEEIEALDGPTADSMAVMVSIGGGLGIGMGEKQGVIGKDEEAIVLGDESKLPPVEHVQREGMIER
jgi:hypothetical protein